jgi:GNAT superfamily N-acetyltransferase
MENVSVKPYSFDRNEEVLALLHRVFNPWIGDEDYFTWKYEMYHVSGCQFPRGWIIEHEGKIVAFNGYLPRKIKVGNKMIWALQSFDTATDPDCRGFGLFGKLQELIYAEMRKAGIPWLYGWASEIGFKVFTQKVGWTVWGKQHFLLRVLDPEWFIKSKIKNKFISKISSLAIYLLFRRRSTNPKWKGEVREENSFPKGTTRLCEKWTKNFDLIAVRDRSYMNWRKANPFTKQRLICAYENKRLVAYLVHNITEDEEIDILDCAWDNENALMALTSDVEKFANSANYKIIRYRITKDHENTRLFKRSGYFWSRSDFPMIGHCLDCDSDLKNLLWKENKSVYWSYFDRNE